VAKVSRGDPSVLETIRLNLTVLERAIANQDQGTAKRSIDAAEMMFRGLRDVASGAGCDVGTCPEIVDSAGAHLDFAQGDAQALAGCTAPAPDRMIDPEPQVPTSPTAIEIAAEMTRALELRREITSLRRETAGLRRDLAVAKSAFELQPVVDVWLRDVQLHRWRFGVLARLVWSVARCAAGILFRGLRRRR
jgi:hypothetical protein